MKSSNEAEYNYKMSKGSKLIRIAPKMNANNRMPPQTINGNLNKQIGKNKIYS